MFPPPQSVEVRHENSVGEARRTARTIAAALGFAPQACEEIGARNDRACHQPD